MKYIALVFFILFSALGSVSASAHEAGECERLLARLFDKKLRDKPEFDFSAQDPHPDRLEYPHAFAEIRELQIAAEFKRLDPQGFPQQGRPSLETLREILHKISVHPVASLDHLLEYDPSEEIGFCFGRAFAMHVEAMFRGIDDTFIRKAFVLGEFVRPVTAGLERWFYHVSTIILADDGVWYALDPRLPEPTSFKQWFDHSTQYAREGSALYVAPARRISPGDRSYYSPELFHIKRFRNTNRQTHAAVARYLRDFLATYGVVESPKK